MLRGGGSGAGLSLAKARIWDPYDKSECCGGVFVRSRLFNGGGGCSYSRLIPLFSAKSNQQYPRVNKGLAFEKNPKRETRSVTVAQITNADIAAVGEKGAYEKRSP